MRAQLKKRQRNRRAITVGIVVALGVVLVFGAYLLSTAGTPLEKLVGKPLSSADYRGLYTASQSSLGIANQTLMKKIASFSGQPYASGTKPVVVYIGAEFCPYCAFQRWPLVMALMRFGNFTNLSYMLSSSTDVYPDSPTFTFYGSTYKSNYIVFQGYEQEDRSQNPLQTVPSNYTGVFQRFGSSYPFINFADRYVASGSFYFPDQMAAKNWTQIVQLLSSNNLLSNQIISSANAITAAICKVTPGAPSSVCANSSIARLAVVLAAYNQPAGSTRAGTNLASASALGKLQLPPAAWAISSVADPEKQAFQRPV